MGLQKQPSKILLPQVVLTFNEIFALLSRGACLKYLLLGMRNMNMRKGTGNLEVRFVGEIGRKFVKDTLLKSRISIMSEVSLSKSLILKLLFCYCC